MRIYHLSYPRALFSFKFCLLYCDPNDTTSKAAEPPCVPLRSQADFLYFSDRLFFSNPPLTNPHWPLSPRFPSPPDERPQPRRTVRQPRSSLSFSRYIDGEGLRKSVGSFSSRARPEGFSSLYALNPESLSARGSPRPESRDFAGPYHDDPDSRALPHNPFDGPSVPLSTFSSQPRFLSEKQDVYPSKTSSPVVTPSFFPPSVAYFSLPSSFPCSTSSLPRH